MKAVFVNARAADWVEMDGAWSSERPAAPGPAGERLYPGGSIK